VIEGNTLEVQGDQVDIVVDWLIKEGFKDVKRSGGSPKKK
jgi:translation initiation factor 1 (eIF-1/SUI1)